MDKKQKYGMKYFIAIISILFIIPTSQALPIHLKPLNNGSLQPQAAFSYEFNFTTQNICDDFSGVLLTNSSVLITGEDGIAFTDIDITGINNIPTRLCTYRNGTLISNDSFSNLIFNSNLMQSLNVSGTINASAFIGDGSALTNIPGVSNGTIDALTLNGLLSSSYINISGGTLTGSIRANKNASINIGNSSSWFQTSYVNFYHGDGSNLTNIPGVSNSTTDALTLNNELGLFYQNLDNGLNGVNSSQIDDASIMASDIASTFGNTTAEMVTVINANPTGNTSAEIQTVINANPTGNTTTEIINTVNGTTDALTLQGALKSFFQNAGNIVNGIFNTSQIVDAFLLNTGDTATGNYTFDTGTLFIDSTVNKIGIGTVYPFDELTVIGTANATFLKGDGSNITNIHSGNTTSEIQTVINANPTGNTSAEIQTVINANPTGNTTTEIINTVNGTTDALTLQGALKSFFQNLGNMIFGSVNSSQITDGSIMAVDIASTFGNTTSQIQTVINANPTGNTTAEIQTVINANPTGNTTTEMITAINGSSDAVTLNNKVGAFYQNIGNFITGSINDSQADNDLTITSTSPINTTKTISISTNDTYMYFGDNGGTGAFKIGWNSTCDCFQMG